jgi:ATP-dependent helicase Lhr and Lhr-like helicase
MAALNEWRGRPDRAAAPDPPFRELGRRSLEAVLDMISGRYPSEEFGELRPRIVWERLDGAVQGRAGAQWLTGPLFGLRPCRAD